MNALFKIDYAYYATLPLMARKLQFGAMGMSEITVQADAQQGAAQARVPYRERKIALYTAIFECDPDAGMRAEAERGLASLGAPPDPARNGITKFEATQPLPPFTTQNSSGQTLEITGGDGLIKQPAEIPDDVFLLSGDNRAILRGQRAAPSVPTVTPRIVMIVLLGFFASLLWAAQLYAVAFVIGALVAVILWSVIKAMRKQGALTSQGKLLVGQVSTADAQWLWKTSRIGTGAGKRAETVRKPNYLVSVTYRCRTPDGVILCKQGELLDKYPIHKPLPEPGTPVVILFANRDQFEML